MCGRGVRKHTAKTGVCVTHTVSTNVKAGRVIMIMPYKLLMDDIDDAWMT